MIIGFCGQAGSGKDTAADLLVKNHGFAKVALADPLKRICWDVFNFTEEQLWGPSAERNKPDERYLRTLSDDEWAARYEDKDWVYLCFPCYRATGKVREDDPDARAEIRKDFKKDPSIRCGICGGAPNPSTARWVPTDGIMSVLLTPRHALQQLGTEWGRNCYPNVWVDYALRVARVLSTGGYYYDAKYGVRSLTGVGEMIQAKTDVAISDVRFLNEVTAIKSEGGKIVRMMRGAGLEGTAGQHRSEKELNEIPEELFDHVLDNREWSKEHLETEILMMLGGFKDLE